MIYICAECFVDEDSFLPPEGWTRCKECRAWLCPEHGAPDLCIACEELAIDQGQMSGLDLDAAILRALEA
jgi:hypothetical protein